MRSYECFNKIPSIPHGEVRDATVRARGRDGNVHVPAARVGRQNGNARTLTHGAVLTFLPTYCGNTPAGDTLVAAVERVSRDAPKDPDTPQSAARAAAPGRSPRPAEQWTGARAGAKTTDSDR